MPTRWVSTATTCGCRSSDWSATTLPPDTTATVTLASSTVGTLGWRSTLATVPYTWIDTATTGTVDRLGWVAGFFTGGAVVVPPSNAFFTGGAALIPPPNAPHAVPPAATLPAASRWRDYRHRTRQAARRSRQLLRQVLTPAQWAQYDRGEGIEVLAASGVRYRVMAGDYAGNVRELGEDGQPVIIWCGHLRGDYPLPDHLIAQVLALQHDEARFRAVAHGRRVSRREA